MSAPEWMHPDEPALAEGARARLKKLPKGRIVSSAVVSEDNKGKAPDLSLEIDGPILVDFNDSREHAEDGHHRDIFRWAILYENQRGLTLFSNPYYSSRSLLPHDPQPFTEPDPGQSSPSTHPHNAPPNVSPATYMLPDPTWRWVSKSWMIDMRGDGDVQHDGFEYNWFFRRAGWRPRVGWFSAGGFVRRRRWIRLMMRPSDERLQAESTFDERALAEAARPVVKEEGPQPRVWRGDADDWSRVHVALKAHARDGPRLELWANWLADLGGAPVRTRLRGWTEDEGERDMQPEAEKSIILPEVHERPSREWVLAVVRSHFVDVLGLFIYPDSRAQLRDMLLRAGVGQEIFIGAPASSQGQFLGLNDFWSRTNELELLAAASEKDRSPA